MNERPPLALALLTLVGCVYFNGVYNARRAERRGDALARAGNAAQADSAYASAAAKAETLLAHHPRSGWTDEALYIAGRGSALSAQCDRALPRLRAYLARGTADSARRQRAELALASCLARGGLHAEARALAEPLTRSDDRAVATLAALWTGRAAIALGDDEAGIRHLRSVGAVAAQWELAAAYLARRDYAAAESLLVLRARDGDYRPEAAQLLTSLAHGAGAPAVERVTEAYRASRLDAVARASLHLSLADSYAQRGNDSLARSHLLEARRVGRDAAAARDAGARLTRLALRSAATVADLESVVRDGRDHAAGSALQRSLEDNVLLLKLLEARADYTGGTLFLAGEVARDSLGALRLAHTLFMRVVSSVAGGPLGAKALLAAAALAPDSAEAYRARLRREYARTAYAAIVEHGDSLAAARSAETDTALRVAWTEAIALFADSVRKLRPGAGASGAAVAAADSAGRVPAARTVPSPP